MGCGTAVGRTGWPSRAGLAGFWCTGWAGGLRADVPEPSPDPGRGEPTGRSGSLPWSAQIAGERPGEAELGVAGDDQPGPPVGGLSIADLGCGPAQGLLEQAEGVLKIEAAQERLPEPVDVVGRGVGARPPQPDRFGVASARQMVDLQADDRPLDDGQFTRRAAWLDREGEPWVQPVPGV